MSKLVKPAEYAKETGISRQAVYAKIKRGTLKSKEVGDQIYIVVDDESKTKVQSESSMPPPSAEENRKFNNIQSVIDSKNETIETLKGRIKDLKESNEQLTSVFRGEIDLLKDAFVEMKRLYSTQVTKKEDLLLEGNVITQQKSPQIVWINSKQILKKYGYDNAKRSKLKNYLEFLYNSGDTRVSKIEGKVRLDERFCTQQIVKDAFFD